MQNNTYLTPEILIESSPETVSMDIKTMMSKEKLLNQFAEILYRSYLRKYPEELENMDLFIQSQPELKQVA